VERQFPSGTLLSGCDIRAIYTARLLFAIKDVVLEIDCFGICAVWPMECAVRFSLSVLHSVVSELIDDNFQSDFTIATRVACKLLDVVVIWSLVGSSIFAITRCGGRDSAAASSTDARTTDVREQEPRSTQTNFGRWSTIDGLLCCM
jgi:hypothetical protein